MIDSDMIDYIKMLRGQGKTDAQIKQSLLPGGWKSEDIDAAFQAIEDQRLATLNQSQERKWEWVKPLLIMLAAVAVAGLAYGSLFTPKSIEVTGSNVLIQYGKLKIDARALPEARHKFVINSGAREKLNDGIFAAWTKKQADELKETYGDFTHCGSDGMQAGMSSLNTVILYGVDDDARSKISNLIKVSKNLPVVELMAQELEIRDQTFNNMKFELIGAGNVKYYLVRDMFFLKKDYNE